MARDEVDLMARQVLRQNDRGTYTVPNGSVYPFQWNWDSAFVAMGFATFDLDRAWCEIESLFSGQWSDGFVPHIIFWKDDAGYFPGPAVWSSGRSPPTSGITQPPVAASTARILWEHDASKMHEMRLRRLFPKMLAWHRWFASARDSQHIGLPVIVHPWESGRDNSPEWDIPASSVDVSRVGAYERRDTGHLDERMRPTRVDYDRYVALLQFGRALNWDHERIGRESPFRVVDVGVTMILLRANRDLLFLADKLGLDDAVTELRSTVDRMERCASWLWDDEIGAYCSRDAVTGRSSQLVTSASFLSFYAGVLDSARDVRLLNHLSRISRSVKFLLPSLDPAVPEFDARRYWRGPAWAVINYLVGNGLQSAGHYDWAERIRADTRRLIEVHGMYEYFCPLSGLGIGGDDFSWTASIWLHWARQ